MASLQPQSHPLQESPLEFLQYGLVHHPAPIGQMVEQSVSRAHHVISVSELSKELGHVVLNFEGNGFSGGADFVLPF